MSWLGWQRHPEGAMGSSREVAEPGPPLAQGGFRCPLPWPLRLRSVTRRVLAVEREFVELLLPPLGGGRGPHRLMRCHAS